jgi:hypothetical protein
MLGNAKVEISLQILSLVERMILTWFVNNITVQLKWNMIACTGFSCLSSVSISELLCVRNERKIF